MKRRGYDNVALRLAKRECQAAPAGAVVSVAAGCLPPAACRTSSTASSH